MGSASSQCLPDTNCMGGSWLNPMAVTPRRIFETQASTAEDETDARLNAIVCTTENQLLVVDTNNNAIKLLDIEDFKPTVVSSLTLEVEPFGAVQLPDGVIAVTTVNKYIYLLDILNSKIIHRNRIHTIREYRGITAFPDHSKVLVSCRKDRHGPAKVDLIDRNNGTLVKTLVDQDSLPTLFCPYYIRLADRSNLIVSGFATHCLYKVKLSTGKVVQTLTHAKLVFPQQVTSDAGGNIFVASAYGHCVLALNRRGEWCRLLDAELHSDRGYDKPYGLSLFNGGIVVAWNKPNEPTSSLLIAYTLKAHR